MRLNDFEKELILGLIEGGVKWVMKLTPTLLIKN